ncbi:DNA methyltransferase [Planococcus rifietoensis]|uniref:DNA methyltransferase n=1 Tax=Planococcus rifietoensis TaxID=200991 RepID=UPI00384D5FC8
MNKLQTQLNSYGESYWNFNHSKRDGAHKIANYPAMMVAPMQYKIIEDIYTMEGNVKNILDPFHGSGTTLVEGKKFNLNLIGIDINPLANLITEVKINGVNSITIYNSIEQVIFNIKKFSKEDIEPYSFNKIEKWFRDDIIKDLTIIRESILLEKNQRHRMYFWVCLSDCIRKHSNTRSSTFKLHIKEKVKIEEMENNVISDFIKSINSNHINLTSSHRGGQSLLQGDSVDEMKKLEDESIDLICTSPPYGDNGTTVTYGQFSILSLLWIDKKDIKVSDDMLVSNYSAIDSYSLGGKKKKDISYNSESLTKVLNQISVAKQTKVKVFFSDYFIALTEMVRLLKSNHLMVLTLGNRRVDNIEVPLDVITKEFCVANGMEVEAILNREIPRKNMPRRVSHIVNLGSVSSMNKEVVLILRKRRE